ncbi:metallophosphoesterase [Candidatus Woesearchaeota archaeon]|nr:metallophosphoesterase [Candidatus Woesearchaeota archaeon]
MKILAFTDTHGSLQALKRIEQKVKTQKPDLLVCSGDISIFEHGIVGIMRRLNRLNKKIIIIHGNHEDDSTFRKLSKVFKNIVFVHKNYFIENNILFLGYGGGGFTLIDREFDKIANIKFKKTIKNNQNKKIILVTHAPPYKTRLDKLIQGHCGSKSIRHFVEKNRIDLLICGHLHENFGKEDKIKKTKIVNPGPFGKIIII